jgi:2-hydroxychromene-2-carboxylate isomerase
LHFIHIKQGALRGQTRTLQALQLRFNSLLDGLAAAGVALASPRLIAKNLEATGINENTTGVKAGGRTARQVRQQLETQTVKSVVFGSNYLAV